MALNPSTNRPIKIHMMRIRATFDDGTVVENTIAPSHRSDAIGILNSIAPFITTPTGQNVRHIDIQVGNGQDTAL